MNGADKGDESTRQTDALLWLGGAVIVGMGAIWLVLASPWSGDDDDSAAESAQAAEPGPRPEGPATASGRAQIESNLEDSPLRMAELAYEAGMLVEPAEYSAWTLYRQALDQNPENAAAREGLERIADELLERAEVALEQGRFDDARTTVARIRDALPVHTGANDLEIRIDELERRSEAESERAAQSDEPADADEADEPQESVADAADEAPEPEPEPEVDPLAAPYTAFEEALAENRLLTPSNGSAKYHLSVLNELDPQHELTEGARRLLFAELIGRADAAIDDLDEVAAETWLAEAEALGVNGSAVSAAKERLREGLIARESARRMPASALAMEDYVPPTYPQRALERGIEGWVAVEFTVTRAGRARDIVVTDASHEAYFRREAVEAIEQWRFEPRVFMGEAIEQRAYTRINFTLE